MDSRHTRMGCHPKTLLESVILRVMCQRSMDIFVLPFRVVENSIEGSREEANLLFLALVQRSILKTDHLPQMLPRLEDE